MKPSTISVEQWVKILTAALYVGLSAGISYVISLVTQNPDLFGPLTPIINVILVTLKQWFTKE